MTVTLVALVLGLWVHRNEKQKRTVKELRFLGGEVHYSYEMEQNSEGKPVPTAEADPPGPKWLRDQIGLDSFATVSSVRLPGDDTLATTHSLWSESCTLVVPDVLEFSKLQSLELQGFNIREDDLAGFSRLSKLESLALYHVPISVEGFRQIGKLVQLEELLMAKSGIDHQGLECLQNLTSLTNLGLYGERVSGTGLKCLEGMQKLKKLDLRCANTIDEDLKYLAALSSLEEVYLGNTPISGPGIKYLLDLPKLRIISIEGCTITYAKWIEKLQEFNPNLLVMR